MWRRLFGRRVPDADLEEELQGHLAIEVKQLMESGMTRERAELEARRRLGSSALILEDTRAVRGHPAAGGLLQDVRYAARVLLRGRAFTVAAILSLALGIAAATAVFSIYDTIFLRALPYRDAAQLTWVGVRFPHMAVEFVPSPDYVAWRRDNQTFQQLAATQANLGNALVLGGANPAEVHVLRVSANFLDAFGAAPLLGRNFRTEEEMPNAPRVALLTYQFWRDHFHLDRRVVGSTIPLDGQPHLVAGILPESFVLPVDAKIDVVTNLVVPPNASHHDRSMSTWAVFGRLKSGVSIQQARVDMERLYRVSAADVPNLFRNSPLVIQPLRDRRAGDVHTLLYILMGAAGCLLAIACANVANLLLARWSARSRELAVRAAIGAGRGRLARQLFTEIGLLIGAGTAVAMVLVAAALRGFVHFAGAEFPRMSEVSTDYRVFGIAALMALATALVFGGLPAVRAGRVDLQSVLQQAGRGSVTGGHGILRRMLVMVEVGLSVVLLCGAALLLQTLWHMQYDHLGLQPEHVLTVAVPWPGRTFDPAARVVVANDVLETLRALPGTQEAAVTECGPMAGGSGSVTFSRSDRPLPERFQQTDGIGICGVGNGFFEASGMRLVQGRRFGDDDLHHPNTVAVINEAAARAYFPGENVLGKQILGGRAAGWKTVVGVVGDVKNRGLNRATAPEAFVNDPTQMNQGDLLFVARTLTAEPGVARALGDELRASHPGFLAKVETMDETIGQMSAGPRFNTVLVAAFAGLAFLMAVIGVYGVLAFSVTQRRAEIGIRMALGASPGAVLGMVMKEGALLVALGTAAGVGGALLLTRYLATLLYGVAARDPLTYVVVAGVLAAAAGVASFLPARRAAVLDPLVALRHEW
ncbi:MAG TPA: ABC transporter permease [Candidatus Sulfopaludibacter sp.]|jgi:putative ABC transport system permease protein|nr:ABC transporter permease [Candidatus Sulfopaludibacter sp.]